MALEKKSTKDDADKSSEKVSKKSASKNSSEKNTDTVKKSTKKDEDAKKSSSSKKKHPERSGNPAKAAKALEEESRAAANRVSRTPTKVKDTASPRWYAPTMVTLLVIGLLWVVTTYLFNGQYPLPYFTKHHATDWLLNGNLYIGFLIMMSGFLGLLRWK
ncbi:septation inhibitor protein [Actinomyces naeslundii]|uniref:Cell division protein CrgA n=1 Tax=Actinomyces naeslundii TaxID=1655 RepID=A0ABX3F113_ACTNA|nr:cell division protein CrgA [Actinomyces naeslundii]OLO81098.1 septation inhibitor protein [Actinomyces naeslundii]OLO85070.1 septation inhibitor protein [Actinomyces naeslundii]